MNVKKLFVVLAVAMVMFSMVLATACATGEVKDLKKNTGITIDFKKKVSSYKVTWNANGGTIASKKTKVTNVKKGSKIGKLATPKRTGYTFKGWYTKKTGGSKVSVNNKPTKSITYTAQWAFPIKWDANGGKIGSKKTISTTVKENTKIGKFPTKPTRKGYIFKGWFTKPIGGTKVGLSNKPTKPVTYNAQWEKDPLAPLTSDDDDDLAPLGIKLIKARHLGKWTCVIDVKDGVINGQIIDTLTIEQGSYTLTQDYINKGGDNSYYVQKGDFIVLSAKEYPFKPQKFFISDVSASYNLKCSNVKYQDRFISSRGDDSGWSNWKKPSSDLPLLLFYWETNTGMESLQLNGNTFYKNLKIVKK